MRNVERTDEFAVPYQDFSAEMVAALPLHIWPM
jgi:hypothetical protein